MLFGVPLKREAKKTEKFGELLVLELLPFKGKGTSRTMRLSRNASEALGIDHNSEFTQQVSFSFDVISNEVFIANTTGLTGVSEAKVTKSSTISDKKYYEEIKKVFGEKEELNLELFHSGEYNGKNMFKLRLLSEEVEPVGQSEIDPGMTSISVLSNEELSELAEEVKAFKKEQGEFFTEEASEVVENNDVQVEVENNETEEYEDDFLGFSSEDGLL